MPNTDCKSGPKKERQHTNLKVVTSVKESSRDHIYNELSSIRQTLSVTKPPIPYSNEGRLEGQEFFHNLRKAKTSLDNLLHYVGEVNKELFHD